MTIAHILGFPRIGAQRELKAALESFWKEAIPVAQLEDAGRQLRNRHWDREAAAGLGFVTTGDFSFYDHMLDHAVLLGCLPGRFGFDARKLERKDYFALARGNKEQPAMEMTKWFDTNYHYLVPELDAETRFDGGPDWYFDQVAEALARGKAVKPVLIGPLTFLRLSKSTDPQFDRLTLLPPLARAYARILGQLKALGVEWVQIDEPALVTDLELVWLEGFKAAYEVLAKEAPKLLLASYFGGVAEHAARITALPVQGIHLDLVRDPGQLQAWVGALPPAWVLSAGVVDGRNVWKTDLRRVLGLLRPVHEKIGDRLWVSASCSLMHVPVSLAGDKGIDPEVRPWLAFAEEKLDELHVLAVALGTGDAAVKPALDAADAALAARRSSARVLDKGVRDKLAKVTDAMTVRGKPFDERIGAQRARLALPPLPTTTIGSFPQTAEIRKTRASFRKGDIGHLKYLEAMRTEIRAAVERQEALGLDVLVHGEAERNDMVEFFGELLWGFTLSSNGWVQSYGSRCVKPPIIYGDVTRPEPMTVEAARYAQSLTSRPMKGMLTGPVTILQWSFVRDDQAREATAMQIALAVREEVEDLEKAGIRVIQIDEPAFREGLPLKRADWARYLDWAVRAFRLSAAVVKDDTQIHTHMCYSEFNDILPAIAAMDADVITIETSRSRMELLEGFGKFKYPNEIGPGVYDIHSPRVPSAEDMLELLERAAEVIPVERLWVNPDCGLKTRGWPETETALKNMVEAARRMRAKLGIEM